MSCFPLISFDLYYLLCFGYVILIHFKSRFHCRRLTRNRIQLQSLVTQQQRCLLCYQWLHEDLLTSPGQSSYGQTTRKEVLTELHKVNYLFSRVIQERLFALVCEMELEMVPYQQIE